MEKKDEYEGLSLWAERMQGLLIENLILCRIGKGNNKYILKKEEQIYAFLSESSFIVERLDCLRVFDNPNLVSLIKDTKDDTYISKIDSIFKEYLKKYFERLNSFIEEYRSSQSLDYNKYSRELFLDKFPNKDEFTLPSGAIITAKDLGYENVLLKNVYELDAALFEKHRKGLAQEKAQREEEIKEHERRIDEDHRSRIDEIHNIVRHYKNCSMGGILIIVLSIIHGLCLWYLEEYWIALTADETAPLLWCLFVAISPVLFIILGIFVFIRYKRWELDEKRELSRKQMEFQNRRLKN